MELNKLYVGAAYYPELWDLSEVEKDVLRCKSLGINLLRIAEFAWASMEPKEGVYTFEWLQTVLDKCYENGISVILCTPTCTPPRWFLDKYEEVRQVNRNDVREEVSSRCQVCKTSKIARDKNREIVTEMAKRFGAHPAVIGWQLDNEIFPYDDGCYCENCKKAFRVYLKEKYGSVENLNKAWGMARWSLTYDDFDAVMPPREGQWRHPSLRKEWWDFQCRQICSFLDEQTEVIRRYSTAPIGTDLMANNVLSVYDVNKNLDVVQYNHYDAYDGLYKNSFAYDFLRAVKDKPFWVTETQVGWNGSNFANSGYRPTGHCYANSWLPVAKGAEMNLYWLFRAHPNGHELAHGALFSTAGREYRVSDEVRNACRDMAKCQDFLAATKVIGKVAIHYSSTSVNLFEVAPLLKDFDYRETLISVHKAFMDRGVNVDVIDTPHDLACYDVLVSPFLNCIEDETATRIREWVKGGGTWIVGPMAGVMTEYASKFTDSPCPLVEELGGVYVKYQKPIDNDVFTAKRQDGSACKVSKWFDAFELTGAKALAKYSDGEEFGGYAVVTENAYGKGKVIVLGSFIDVCDLVDLSGVKGYCDKTSNLTVTARTGSEEGVIIVEIENKAGEITLTDNYVDLISDRRLTGKITVDPYNVLVLKKIN